MIVNALYYQDSHLRQFQAQVVSCVQSGGQYAVVLDQTAFYPEGGGQSWDLGTLADVRVSKVLEQDGSIVHFCDGPLEPGQTVRGTIDWARRFDLMQQHSGEHILSGLIFARFGYHNVGFHMGAETVTIDFDGMIAPEALAELEQAANAAIWENRPVEARFYDGTPDKPYRSKRALTGPVRLVEIPGCDCCACCGTHVRSTGEIGLLKILSWVKFHQGVRLEMVCGGRALRYLSGVLEQNRRISQMLSAKMLETAPAVQQLRQELESARLRVGELEANHIQALARQYTGSGNTLLFEPNLSNTSVRRLADAVGAVCGGQAWVFSGSEEAGYQYALCDPAGDLRPLVQRLNQALQGRGGGKANFVQGGVRAAKSQIEAFFHENT